MRSLILAGLNFKGIKLKNWPKKDYVES